ncbi:MULTISPECIES: beta-L-arabinofuranosidase domain-containing protein [Micromonospora]|uniref:Glycosylase n=1 Tax=Micromonospora haikouensis TaxID=686309 RepID=A0A0D0WQR9_9ACTN|nr:beta-L-arabinofuranosidase domain-containing protein [Micromonospora haikouensis]KIR61351.1 glycosylase [Micromonospora haikouensis]
MTIPLDLRVTGATPAGWAVRPFALADVELGDGLFAAKRSLMLDFARGYDVDRLLQVFRTNAGLDTLGAVAPGGWEGLDGEANGNLRGHFTGHFLTMLAQAYASTGEQVFADRIHYMVGALAEVRQALRDDPVVREATDRPGSVRLIRGSYQYLELPATALGATAEVTLAAWVKPTHDTDWARVFDFGDDTTRYLYLTVRNAAGAPRFAITTTGAEGEQGIDGEQPLPLDEWSHLAVTITCATGTLYVNGVAVGENTAMTLNPEVLGSLTNNWIGRSQYPDDPVFAGALDGVGIWWRALSADEVARLPRSGGGSIVGDPVPRRTWGGPSHPGFLAAYPETQFITLESMTESRYTVVWAPYYTAHKILRGLLDAYRAVGDPVALDLATGLCDWMYARLSVLPDETRQRMWGIFSSGEFGGIVEAICDLYAVTGDPRHAALARLFDLDSLIDACAAGRDVLDGLHANQHIPIFIGLVRLHEVTGEQRYLTAARRFWDMVIPTRMYSIGGTSTVEFWRAAGVIAGSLGELTAETCCAYNLLKLSRMLFLHDRDPKYMDYYERAMYNQVPGSKRDLADAEKPLVTYFIGLTPGHVRDYTPKEGATCCEGTGMESATKYQDTVYLAAVDGSALYVNLYSPSTLGWAERGITVVQDTRYPYAQDTTLTIHGEGAFDLCLRVPGWARDGFEVQVNGERTAGTAGPDGYLTISRAWRDGDTVGVRIPFRLRVERALDDPGIQTLFYGPVNLVARDARSTLLPVSLYPTARLSGDLIAALTPEPGAPLHFTLDGVPVAPFFEGTDDPTHVYFRRSEPQVIFAGLDSGVANPVRDDGTGLLDEVWDAAPFRDQEALVDRVRAVVDAWVDGGLLTAGDGDRIVVAAAAAPFQI